MGALPELYAPWIEEALGGPLPVETRATCDRCVMMSRGEVDDPDVPYDPVTRCCTYTPHLPNFLVGAILGDGGPVAGVLGARIDAREGLTPLGLSPSAEALESYGATVTAHPAAFGRTPSLRCPYLEVATGRCGVWRHRNGTCSTWFCRHERGGRGRAAWTIVAGVLDLVERVLSLHCLDTLGLSSAACQALYLDNQPPPRDHPVHMAVWGPHLGGERAFFAACAAHVRDLPWSRVLELGGDNLAMAVASLRSSQAELADSGVPPEVQPGRDVLYRIGRRPGHVRASAGLAVPDFLELPERVVAALPRLIGRPLEEALAELAAEGLELDPATVLKLLDFGLLVPSGT